MNVQFPSDPRSSAPVAPVGAASSDDARPAPAPTTPAAGGPEPGGDRLEISARARADARRAGAADAPEIETARHALRAADALGPARLHELREQVRTGHYDGPEAIERMTQAVVRDLGR